MSFKAVARVTASIEIMSRHQMLHWVNSTVGGRYEKIEELCAGVAYCQLMEQLFPNCIGLKRVKVDAKCEYEYIYNLKLFQTALTRLHFDKSVPIDRLIKGRFQDNFEFLKWFKSFYEDASAVKKENLRANVKTGGEAAVTVGKLKRASSTPTLGGNGPKAKPTANVAPSRKSINSQATQQQLTEERSISPSSLNVMQETVEQLSQQMKAIENECKFYYKKLTDIEKIVQKSIEKNENVAWCKRALAILNNNETIEESESA